MTKEELDIQKEIEKYFTESTGFGRDKIKNFMDIVNKTLKQKGERITELEKQIKKMKCCQNCKHLNSLVYGEVSCDLYGECNHYSKWEIKEND